MKKQWPAILLGIGCVALLIAYTNSNKTVKQLREEIAKLQVAKKTDISAPQADTTVQKKTAPESLASQQTNSPEQMVSMQDTKQPAEATKPSGRRMMENIAKMMDNPTMNRVMEASQRGAVVALYSDLMADLNLSDQEAKYFMNLLMYRQRKQIETGMKMMSGSLSPEEKQALADELKKTRETFTEDMKQFLNNPNDFNEFEYYEKTINERIMLSQMDKDLADSSATLSDQTYSDLLGMMHDERKNFSFTSDLGNQQNTDMSPQRFSKQNIQNYASDIKKLNNIISQKAQAMLTPEQYTAFEKCLKTQTDMQLSQLEMAAQMFGGGIKTESK